MQKLLKWNPELAKNFWLEFSTQRLVVMPALIALVSVLILSNSSSLDSAMETLHSVSFGGFIAIGMLWGVKSSAEAITDEYNNRTWDWQKMSIIGPFKLAIGKLFGSTAYNWYGALICWIIYMLTIGFAKNPNTDMINGIVLIIGTIALHGIVMLLSLQLIRKSDGRSKIRTNGIFIAGFAFIGYLSQFIFGNFMRNETMNWYGIEASAATNSLITTTFYCFWIIAGLYRTMRAELQFSDRPVWWIAFLASSILFQYGYFAFSDVLSSGNSIAAAFGLNFIEQIGLIYILALAEKKDVVNFRTLETAWKSGNKIKLLQEMPLWMVTIPIAAICGFIAVIFFSMNEESLQMIRKFSGLNLENSIRIYLFVPTILSFMIRDLGILLMLNLSSRHRRADGATIVYLLVLYLLIPMILKNSGLGPVFYPDLTANPYVMFLFPLIEAGVVIYMLRNRWREVR